MLNLSAVFSGVKTFFGSGKLWLIIALALTAFIGWLLLSRANLKTDLATAEANVATLQGANRAKARAIEDMQGALKTTETALATRELTLRTISAQHDALRRQLGEVLHNDPTARAWAAQPVPAAVRQLLSRP